MLASLSKVTSLKLLEVVDINFFFLFCYVRVLHLLISKNALLVGGYAKVQRPCVSFILLNNFLLTEACFNVYRFVAVTYFSTIVFVLAWSLNEINYTTTTSQL